jgi:hypothetical protein
MNHTVPIAAAAGLAAVIVAGSAVLGAATADASGGQSASITPHLSAKKAQVTACSGGPLLSMTSRTMDVQTIAAGATAEVEGSQFTVKGPKQGTDRVLVTLSALAINGTSQIGTASLYKDGVGTPEGTKYFGYGSTPATIQFCGTINKGQHTFTLRMQDDGGTGLTMYNPTITYLRFS